MTVRVDSGIYPGYGNKLVTVEGQKVIQPGEKTAVQTILGVLGVDCADDNSESKFYADLYGIPGIRIAGGREKRPVRIEFSLKKGQTALLGPTDTRATRNTLITHE